MDSIRTRLTVAAGVVIIALTAAAFWLSYAHLHDVAATYGLGGSPERAWAWPATLDLFIVAGEILMLVAALNGKRDAWAIGLTVTGSVGSIALNVLGVGPDADRLAYVVAAVPPAAALLAFGALMRQLHAAVSKPDESTAETSEDRRTANELVQDAQLTVATQAKAHEERMTALDNSPDGFAAVVDGMVEELAKETGTPVEWLKPGPEDLARTQEAVNRLAADMERVGAGATGRPVPFTIGEDLEEVLADVEGQEDAERGYEEEPAVEPDTVHEVLRITSKPSHADMAAAVEDIKRDGLPVNGSSLAEYFGVSDRSGRRYLKEYQAAQDAHTGSSLRVGA